MKYMPSLRNLRTFVLMVTAASFLAACAETKFVMATAKRLGETNKPVGTYKVGKPYQVKGIWYYPSEDWTYDRTGIASWYGPNFHGKPTANGEVFDQWEVSAAHKTLPMPSMVRVTNLGNGRSLVVRVNDRGPFKPGRIIDMSKRGAQLLGFEGQGTAQVRVEILTQESMNLAGQIQSPVKPLTKAESPIKVETVASKPVASQDLPELVASAPLPQKIPTEIVKPVEPKIVEQNLVQQKPIYATRMYVQAGAFGNIDNAERVKARLSFIGDIIVSPFALNGRELYRVRVGPVYDVAAVDQLLAKVIDAGFTGARTVVETN